MTTLSNEKQGSIQQALSEEERTQIIITNWIRISNIKLGWINDFNKFIVNYVIIDYTTFNDCQLICSGSADKTVRVWDIETNKQIQLFNGHLGYVYSAKFSSYHNYNYHRNVICSSSTDKTIRFSDVNDNQQLQVFNEHTQGVLDIEFSSFNGGRYLCSGSKDKTIRLWDVETSKNLHTFNGHEESVWSVKFSPLQNNNNNIGVIGGNGYTICSGSRDKTIRIWDVETTKQLIEFKGHEKWIMNVKYGSNKLGNIGCSNTILSSSQDNSVRLWDIRSGQQIQIFNGHKHWIHEVEYSPFVINNIEVGGFSNVICSASLDKTIRFWDIRSNKDQLHAIHADAREDKGILCLKFISLKKKNEEKINDNCDIHLYYGSFKVLFNYSLIKYFLINFFKNIMQSLYI
ncbi:WD-40 repeat protein [Reticulomyxa filosa]|uniref:WD-40 repeat protein n=1 Tax=Reticulomyxa filosa TaxID=46433 RepID=X6LKI5_RETFI|nr:WD-40 repeat protein [Reticulomyxa filosa]|eukprot:ETO02139.1 WD-40 repeat protein [Reticulomyxa filosa]